MKQKIRKVSKRMILNDKAFNSFIEFAPRGDNDNMN